MGQYEEIFMISPPSLILVRVEFDLIKSHIPVEKEATMWEEAIPN